MNKTSIEWVKNPDGSPGYTWNPITGCTGGCPYCYARKLANGRLKSRYLANTILPSHDEPGHEKNHEDPFYPRFWPSKLKEINPPTFKGRMPKRRGVFVCDMSDLFGIGVTEDWTRKVLDTIRVTGAKNGNRDRFYLLTKQPQNMSEYSPFPGNCWVGVSATSYAMMLNALNELASIDAKIKYLSFEPLLSWDNPYTARELAEFFSAQQLDWIIIGAQTKPYNPPKIEWVSEIVAAADLAGVPVFLKNNLKPLLMDINQQYSLHNWASNSIHQLRQEMP